MQLLVAAGKLTPEVIELGEDVDLIRCGDVTRDGDTDAVFTIKVPDEEWEDKHKLALEREVLGLYVSGHPLNGLAHLLAAELLRFLQDR